MKGLIAAALLGLTLAHQDHHYRGKHQVSAPQAKDEVSADDEQALNTNSD